MFSVLMYIHDALFKCMASTITAFFQHHYLCRMRLIVQSNVQTDQVITIDLHVLLVKHCGRRLLLAPIVVDPFVTGLFKFSFMIYNILISLILTIRF